MLLSGRFMGRYILVFESVIYRRILANKSAVLYQVFTCMCVAVHRARNGVFRRKIVELSCDLAVVDNRFKLDQPLRALPSHAGCR